MLKTTIAMTLLILLLCNASARAVSFNWVTVANPGNGPDGTGFGSVDYIYRIAKHEVTNAQYAEFLNAVDPVGANPHLGGDDPYLFSEYMSSSASGGINLMSGATKGSKYQVKPGHDNNPVIFVSFFDAMRFSNWLENGQGNGLTELGSYTIGDGVNEVRNPRATYFIPSVNEWYKAAFHKNDGVTASYWKYATSTNVEPYSDQPPGTDAPTPSNTANFRRFDGFGNSYNDGYAVTGSTGISISQNYLTDVGAYATSSSPYGTFDQGGNVSEWNEEVINSTFRGSRGGYWNSDSSFLVASSQFFADVPSNENDSVGFRVASLPERVAGDFNGDGLLTVADIDQLANAIRVAPETATLDITGDKLVTLSDHEFWIHHLKKTYYGDANFDLEFNSADLIATFQAGEYEDSSIGSSNWATGDWNADGDFDSGDLVIAFQDGGYEAGQRGSVAAVPEPGTIGRLGLCFVMLFQISRRRVARQIDECRVTLRRV